MTKLNNILPTNCPNCSGRLVNGSCMFCGTRMFVTDTLNIGEFGQCDINLQVKRGNDIYIIPLTGIVREIAFTSEPVTAAFGDSKYILERTAENVEFTFEGSVRNGR